MSDYPKLEFCSVSVAPGLLPTAMTTLPVSARAPTARPLPKYEWSAEEEALRRAEELQVEEARERAAARERSASAVLSEETARATSEAATSSEAGETASVASEGASPAGGQPPAAGASGSPGASPAAAPAAALPSGGAGSTAAAENEDACLVFARANCTIGDEVSVENLAESMRTLLGMGFAEDEVKTALLQHGHDRKRAAEWLCR